MICYVLKVIREIQLSFLFFFYLWRTRAKEEKGYEITIFCVGFIWRLVLLLFNFASMLFSTWKGPPVFIFSCSFIFRDWVQKANSGRSVSDETENILKLVLYSVVIFVRYKTILDNWVVLDSVQKHNRPKQMINSFTADKCVVLNELHTHRCHNDRWKHLTFPLVRFLNCLYTNSVTGNHRVW